MNIQQMKVADLRPFSGNAKKHDDTQIKNVMQSIKEYGIVQPLVCDKDNILIIGHCRLLACKRLGIKEVPVVRMEELTEEEANKLRLLDNKLNESEWDFELLAEQVPDLDFSDFDIDWGIPEDPEDDIQVVEDEPPEDPPTLTKSGDIWILGRHRLLCGDSTDPAVIDRLMDGAKANMVFTDPPYGYNYQSNMRTQSEKFDVLENDDKILDFFQSIKNTVVGFVYVCTTWKTADKWIELFKNYYELTNVIIWDKGGGGIGDLFHTFSTDYEMILVCNNGQELRGKRYGSVWNFTNTEISKMKKEELLKIVLEQKEYYSIWKQKKDNPNEYVHPTQKPVALSAKAIRSSTDFDEIVLDVFGGSGSTLIACEQLNRTCYMCELDPKYADVIVQRWLNFTGRKDQITCIRDGQEITYDEASARAEEEGETSDV